jgi:Spy/CpxP family protein refolding chaperone
MRTVIISTMSALLLSAPPASAQQAAKPCQAEEVAVQRSKVLAEAQAVAPQQLEAAQNALALCQALQAQLAAREPTLAALRAAESALRAQQAALSARQDARVERSLKQSSGGLQTGLADLWWKNPAATQYLGLTADQQKKMDDVFQQSRSTLMQLNYTLEREEGKLERLVAEPLDEGAIAAQIDRVAQARADLEKANGRMLLGIRKQLTPDQWTKLSQISSLAQPPGK